MNKVLLFFTVILLLVFPSCSVTTQSFADNLLPVASPLITTEANSSKSEVLYSGEVYSDSILKTNRIDIEGSTVIFPVLPSEELTDSLMHQLSELLVNNEISYRPNVIDFEYFESANKSTFVFYVSDNAELYDISRFEFSYNRMTLKELFPGEETPPVLSVFHPESYQPVTADDKKFVAITFDDGPNPYTTPQLVEMLAEKNVKATFFMVGINASAYPSTVKKVYEGGHDIGIHSYGHNNFYLMSDEEVIEDLDNCAQLIDSIVGKKPYLVRPPYGNIKLDNIQTSDYFFVNWNIDTLDWKQDDAAKIAQDALKDIKSGSIVLLHDIYQKSCDAAEIIIDELLAQGYRFVTISEFYDLNGRLPDNKLHYFMGDYDVKKG